MHIRDVDFGPVWGASGVQGFFGEGYWFHRWVPGLDFDGCTFVAKTTTLLERRGNMPLKKGGKPKSLVPKCIIVKPFKGVTLNSIGLSGPGAQALLNTGQWQARKTPFLLSFMPVAADPAERLAEAGFFIELLEKHLPLFQTRIALQINLSCPNAGHDPSALAIEAAAMLTLMNGIRHKVALIPKVNVLFPIDTVVMLQSVCDGICVSNTLPWGALPDKVDWGGLFGRNWSYEHIYGSHGSRTINLHWVEKEPISPLRERGFSAGGLGGAPLLPLVADWVAEARIAGFSKHINAGGGILGPDDVDVLASAGADSVFLGSIAMLRGWRLRKTIRRAHERLGKKSA